jgi:hypothetical protein
MKKKERDRPLNEIKYTPEYLGLNDLVFGAPSVVLKGIDKKGLPLEVAISNIKITPGTHVRQTKRDLITNPVRMLEGTVDGGKFKGVIRAERFDLANIHERCCQIHFYLEKDGKAYAGKSMEYDPDKKHLTAEMYALHEPTDPNNIGTDYAVNLPLFRVMRAYFEPAKK